VNHVEQHDPDLIQHLSSARSPMAILSSLIKADWAKTKSLRPTDIYNVGIMPCVAKKDEIKRAQLNDKGYVETDLVITTRELIRMIKAAKLDFKSLPDTPFDRCYSIASGAGAIFCGSGGVMEAAVRTAYTYATGKPLEKLDFPEFRGAANGIKRSTVDMDGLKIGVAIAQGIANAQKLIAKIRAKDPEFADVKFVEVMACPGGCVCGGGAPKAKNKKAIDARVDATYRIDKESAYRRSHENPEVIEMYQRFAGEPGSHTAHEFFHTQHTNRNTRGLS
jgi:NADH-quinone oxidoreductase subunit G